jgi:hypothetical protein
VAWLNEHWDFIAVLIVVFVNLLNALTPHFDNYAGVKKVFMVLIDIFSVFASRDSFRTMKWPFVTDKRVE